MLHIIADEFGCDWLCLNTLKKESVFEITRGWNQTKWIVLSSSFFVIPAANHLYYQTPETYSVFPYMLVVTSLVSANYWRNATRGWRRNLDLVVAKTTFSTAVYIAAKYVNSRTYRIPIVVLLCVMPILYNGSTKCVNAGDPTWVKYHFAFHALCSFIGSLILRGTFHDASYCA